MTEEEAIAQLATPAACELRGSPAWAWEGAARQAKGRLDMSPPAFLGEQLREEGEPISRVEYDESESRCHVVFSDGTGTRR